MINFFGTANIAHLKINPDPRALLGGHNRCIFYVIEIFEIGQKLQ
jgi:hypothetical protein